VLRTEGEPDRIIAADAEIGEQAWLPREVRLFWGRTLKRLDHSSRTLVALITPDSCFAGTLAELALAADRFYMLEDEDAPVHVALSALNEGALPMHTRLTRLQTRLLGTPAQLEELVGSRELLDAESADEAGLVTVRLDAIDWDDDTRIAVEERASLSPDALTGMEQNLRFAGPETADSKIYARLSAWQN
jgi:benzoyl-CoA-dihydrodiol lyase